MENNKNEWSGKSRGGTFGHKFFIFLIRRIGVKSAYAFLSLVVVYFIPFAPKATKAIWSYNRRILKYGAIKSALALYRHYYVFGQTIIDKVAINNGLSDKYKFEFDNYDKFIGLLGQGPLFIIGAHVGCWEIGSGFFGNYASRLHVVMYDGEYQKIKESVNSTSAAYKIIAINEGGIESLLKIKQAIDSGGYVCLQGDRYMDVSNTIHARFMGKSAMFPKGPFVLASKFSTPVVFYFAMRERGMRYRFIFKMIDPDKSMKDILYIYLSELESIVHKYPQQWFNFYDVWQKESH